MKLITRMRFLPAMAAAMLLVTQGIPRLEAADVSGIANTYFQVDAVNVGSVTLGNETAGSEGGLAAGDEVVLIEMTGANMGVYELLTVRDVSDSTVKFANGPDRAFADGAIQLVRMPSDDEITVVADVTAAPWNGAVGGVIALQGETLTLNANIDASGVGFSVEHPPGGDSDGEASVIHLTPQGWATSAGTGGGGGIIGGGGGAGGTPMDHFDRRDTQAPTQATATAAGKGVGGSGHPGGDGGEPGLIGNGGNADVPNPTNDGYPGSSGGGGGSYGGGGSGIGVFFSAAYTAGGGGGGSWTGGGQGGKGGTATGWPGSQDGGGDHPSGTEGAVANSSAITKNDYFLHSEDARLMMGGGGGHGPKAALEQGGLGGGVIILDFQTLVGNDNGIAANGAMGERPPSNSVRSGTGGGAGGQIYIAAKQVSDVKTFANGGRGGGSSNNGNHTGGAAGGGGGGGIWFAGIASEDSTNSGANAADNSGESALPAIGDNVTWSVIGGGPVPDPFGTVTVAGVEYDFEEWIGKYNAAGVYSMENGASMGESLAATLPAAESAIEAQFPELFRPNNPKNRGLGAMPGLGGAGLLSVTAPTKDYDMALTKSDGVPSVTSPGGAVTFTIEVTNQSNDPEDAADLMPVTDVEITVNLGGWTLHADALADGWSASDGDTAKKILSGSINKETSADTTIKLVAPAVIENGDYLCYAEITGFKDGDGVDVVDIDSSTDVAGGNDNNETDGVIDGSGGDHDDLDPGKISIVNIVYDMALTKSNGLPSQINPGGEVSFNIELSNQSYNPADSSTDVPVRDIEIYGWVDAGWSLHADSIADGWSAGTVAGSARKVVAGPLAKDAQQTVVLKLVAPAVVSNRAVKCYAEVVSFKDADGTIQADADSDTDLGAGNDSNETDDIITSAGGDHDDLDPGTVTIVNPVYDVALTKSNGSPFQINPGDPVTFTISVNNQSFNPLDGSDTVPVTNTEITSFLGGWTLSAASAAEGWSVSGDTAVKTVVGAIPNNAIHEEAITLLSPLDLLNGDYHCYSEVTSFQDVVSRAQVDVDSSNNIGASNDPSEVDNALDGTNGDHDDLDPGTIQVVNLVYDVGLTKTDATPSQQQPGEDVTFTITVTNQSRNPLDLNENVPVTAVRITDYLPPSGFTFDPAKNTALALGETGIHAGWSGATPTATLINPLASGASRSLSIVLTAEDPVDDGTYVNYAEVVDFKDAGGGDVVDTDSESVVGYQGDLGEENDNNITDPNDHDDLDPESVELVNYEYDVALINTSPAPSSIHPGDDVCFTITVTNQSRNPVDASDDVVVSNILVRDFIPEGFNLDPAKNTATELGAVGVHTDWVGGGQSATTTLLGDLSKDASRSIKIVLTADQELENDVYINYAEVIEFEDDQGRTQEDIDSESDLGANGDANEVDNVINGTLPNQDHDDLDPEPVTVVNYLYDLALRKVGAPGDPIEPGDEALFTITVINQSVDPIDADANVPVQNIQVVDYFPEGFSLSPNESNWVASGVQQARLIEPIALLNTQPNDSVSVQILLRANDPFEDATLDNYAEIVSFEDPQGNTRPDVDSVPSSNADGDLQLVDNEVDAGGPTASQDEDDHDIASIEVVNPIYDLALQKLNATPAVVQPGEDVMFAIRVFNQSYKPLNSDANVPVTQVQVHDYIPVGFILSPEENNWEAVGNNVARLVTPIAEINSQGINFVDVTIKLRPEYPLEDGNYDNYAEVVAFLDEYDRPREDQDSTPGSNAGGDANLVDNQVDGGGSNVGQDEDDHDVESVQVVNPRYDLALVKTHASPEIVSPGGDVTFTIRVTNQSVNPVNLARNVPVANVQVVDYIPEGFTLSADALGWIQVGDTAVLADPIASLDSVGDDTFETTIRLTANDPLSRGDYANFAEIISFEDSFGNNVPDVDSTPDDINDEPGGTIADDDINNQNGDEDDHDVEVVTVGQLVDPKFDLALRKRLAPDQSPTVNPGDLVTFDIEVFNQGTIEADSIRLVDYIRPGFELADNNWSGPIAGADVNAVIYNAPIGLLLPGQSSVINITLKVDENAEYPLTLENYAEIFEARDGAGAIRSDDDSTPDGSAGDLLVDNEVNNDGSFDEDDHDIATVKLNEPGAYDLALRKTLATGQSNTVNVGDTVTFRIEVFNQGAVDASDVQVVDYIPAMLEVVDPSWVVNPAGTRATLANVLETISAGSSAAVNITFRVKENAEGDIDNFAEILSDDGDDRDSRPESQEQNEIADVLQDDLINDDGSNDEDDHDVATVTINPPERYDLALRKSLAVWQSPQVNRGENVTFTLEVFNQGAQEAREIALIDYIPDGLTLNDGNWIPNAAGTRATLATPIASIAPSGSARVNVTFTVDADAEGQLDNYAEIQIDDGDDADSTPEIDEGNDERDALINDEINNDGTTDEDDHDIASVEVNPPNEFDLALRKQLQSGQSPTVNPGDTVTFTIEVFNQGAVPAANVVVIDYIKPSMTLADNAWTERPGGYLEHNAALGVIEPGQSALVTITFTVNEDAEGELACNAEILSATDVNGVPGNDSDSTPDSIDTDPIIDDEINDNGVFDEDDHDTAGVTVNPPGRFDLALRKRLASGQASSVNPGDLVNFELEVFNQGAVTADNVQLVDYIQPGFSLEDPNWSLQGATAVYNNPLGNLDAGASRTVTITLRADADLVGPTTLENLAEIAGATGEDNAEVTDDDSTPDDQSTDKLLDNEINDNGTLDEDDHDIAYVDINAPDKYDLALRHTLAAGQALNVNTGDCVEFTTEVFNQGAAVAEDVQVIVYLNPQLAFVDSGANALWNYNSATHTATTTLLGTLPKGGSRTVEIKTEVRSGANGTLINTAEILADDGEDCDSAPDSVNNEVAVDDAINGEAGDEDDHDIAVVGINEPGTFDLALRKRLANGQSTSVNPGDRVTFEIEVFNQGAVAADNIEVIDYLQTGFTLADANWGAAGQNAIFGQPIGVLQPGESEVITITLDVGSNLVGPLVLRNLAEITAATGENDAAVTDIDSIPDFINGDRLVDDQINNDGTIDEDDHDVATVSINTPDRYDLALRKTVANGQSVMVNPSELVTYTIEVFNQGAVDAFDVDVVDFIPAGLTLEDPSWDDNAAGTQAFLVNKLPLVAAGKSARVNITFRVAENATGQIINAAEINTDDGDDADSRPEDQENNNSGDLLVDDEINDEGNTDEDDHDIAVIGINPPGTFDLALRKRLAPGQSNSVNPGDTVQFDIEVFNQGAVPATDIEVVVYPRPGLLLDDSAWTVIGNYMRHNALLGTIQPGQSTSIAINLQVDPNVQGPTLLDCTAEISVAQDQVLNRPGNDVDSTPDTQDSDQLVDNEINDDGTFDEDDHDIAFINVNAPGTFDLALRKRLANGQSLTVNPGDTVSYEIEIFNQGSVDAKGIQVVDYIDANAFVLSDSNWSIQGINTAVYGIDLGILKPGESQVIGITLEVKSDLVGPATLANHAEISEGINDGPGVLADIDSNPDTAPGDLLIDDRINDDGTFDEDDHDVAYVEINEPGVLDLALRKTLALGQSQTVQEGDLVTFTIEVFNQGAVDASEIEICDYIPAGFELQDSSWAAQGTGVGPDMAQLTINGVLAAGERTTVDLTMRVLEGATDETLIAYAEISDYLPDVADIDSVADRIADNDNGGRPDVNGQDNEINGNGFIDEDDHDPAYVTLVKPGDFDLALRKKLAPGFSIMMRRGADHGFRIELFNQGAETAKDIKVVDYIPEYFILSPNDNNGWQPNGTSQQVVLTVPGPLAPGESTTVDILLQSDPLVPLGVNFFNTAEIYGASDTNGDPIDDIDSNYDTDDDDLLVDDAINNENGDEDDHDIADPIAFLPFDLALRKRLAEGQSAKVNPGETITFEIDVVNQGSVPASNVQIADHAPVGLTLADAHWLPVGGVIELRSTIGIIEPGELVTVPISFIVDEGFEGPLSLTNTAEIASATDDEGNPVTDSDSTPDRLDNEENVRDDELDNGGGDEDDHDIAVIEINPPGVYDLALRKTLASNQALNVQPGDSVTFVLEVFNQGALPATNVEVTDYLTPDLILTDGNWDEVDGKATRTIVGTIPAGESVITTIRFRVADGVAPGEITCLAEISDDNNPTSEPDPDSTPDSDPTNDGDPVDNELDGKAGDEDDSDPATINVLESDVFDLALRKRLASGQSASVNPGDAVIYEIDVINQGAIHAANIQLVDNYPASLILADANWIELSPGVAEYKSLIGVLEPGDVSTVAVTFTVATDVQGPLSLTNVAEIRSATDEDGQPQDDTDSTPDNTPDNDGLVRDDALHNEDGDEDDNDIAVIEINPPGAFDLALRKTLAPDQPLNVQPGDNVSFVIEVFNQGAVEASGVTVGIHPGTGLSLNDGNWELENGLVQRVLPGVIQPGSSLAVSLTMTVVPESQPGALNCFAEILDDNDPTGAGDQDSTPDGIAGNDGTPINDAINGEGGDEDDHDGAKVNVLEPDSFDLALRKRLAEGQSPNVNPGDLISFEIEVFNQGDIAATNIQVASHLGSDVELVDSGWTKFGDLALLKSTLGVIEPGQSQIVGLTLRLREDVNAPADLQCLAEIVSATDIDGDPQTDIDSTPNLDPDDDLFVDDFINDDGALDEDDHDGTNFHVNEPGSFDLALITTLAPGQSPNVNPGDKVVFRTRVFNQGELDARNIVINNIIPEGLSLADDNWVLIDGQAVNVISGGLLAGQSATIDICFIVNDDAPEEIISIAEIGSATDTDGNPVTDVDSTPDNDPDNEGLVRDDELDNTLGDEDDHDIVKLQLNEPGTPDVALRKSLAEGQSPDVARGDVVCYTLEVFNQGSVAVQQIKVCDYVPAGMRFDPALNEEWRAEAAAVVSCIIPGPILPGESFGINVCLTVEEDAPTDAFIKNCAEICAFRDSNGDLLADGDSIVDNIPDNDGRVEDDALNGEKFDEDDHDCERVYVREPDTYDLALRTTLSPGQDTTAARGDEVCFTIEVFNQGEVPANDIRVCDHIPAGLEFNSLENPAWTNLGSGRVVCTIPGPLAPGASHAIEICYSVADDAPVGECLAHTAEICGDDGEDADSTADSDALNDGRVTDDAINGEAFDEDDHDVACVIVSAPDAFDLALRTTVPTGQPESVNPGDTMTLNVEVFNQGAVPAYNVSTVAYLPEGLTLAPGQQWQTNASGQPEVTVFGPIQPGNSLTFPIRVLVDEDAVPGELGLGVELTGATDLAGNLLVDSDSIMDNTPDNDGFVSDDEISGQNGDQDDHDVVSIGVNEPQRFDLALRKRLASGQSPTVNAGDQVTYEIEVFNQGAIAAKNVRVYDYYPSETLTLADDLWTEGVLLGAVICEIPGPIEPGQSASIPITFIVNDDAEGSFDNIAEICEAQDIHGNQREDADGTFDKKPNNDRIVDNLITDDPVDSDDHDIETVEINEAARFDLALRQRLAPGQSVSVNPCDEVQFTVEVFNQGAVPATDVTIVSYIPEGFSLADSGWSATDKLGVVECHIRGPIQPGQSGLFNLTLKVDEGAEGELTSCTEIEAAHNANGVLMTDADSIADCLSNNDRVVDNEINQNGVDEDDHDCETISINPPAVFDLALRTEVGADQSRDVHRNDSVHLVVEVFNQGAQTATNIKVISYLPAHLELNDSQWTLDDDGNACRTIPGPIEPGLSGVLDMIVKVKDSTPLDSIVAVTAEIVSAQNEQGLATLDLDSIPDNIANNDGPLVDNEINNENGDQDDFDVVYLAVIEPDVSEPTTAMLGDTIWEDLNRNGQQDDGEPGIGGINVALLDSSGNPTGQQMSTDVTGRYKFEVDAPGTYQIKVNVPESYNVTTPNQGNDGTDSDIDPDSCITVTPFSVLAGENYPTIDAGLYRASSIGGFVWEDSDRDGIRDQDEPGLSGVEVTLYNEQGQTVGDPIQSEADGSYTFFDLTPGEYSLGCDLIAGYSYSPRDLGNDDTRDSDMDPSSGLTVSTFLMAGETDLSWNCGFYTTEVQSFEQWAVLTEGASASPLGNDDGDLFDDTLEYALALDPGVGANSHDGFCLDLTFDGRLCLVYRRPIGGAPGVTYRLEGSTDLTDSNSWTLLTGLTPEIETHDDGTETLRYCDIDKASQVTEPYGFVRLRVDLAIPASTSYSQIFGWQTTMVNEQCETFNQPFVKKPLYVGSIGENTSSALIVSDASGDMPDMPLDKHLYVEIIDGDYEGHRFDVIVSGKRVVAIEEDSTRNTHGSLPGDLSGSRFMLREHCTVDDLFKKVHFFGTRDPLTADRLLFFAGDGFESVFLLQGLGFFQWTDESDISLNDQGGRVIGPCEGLFIHPRNGEVAVRSYGMVRSNKLRCPLSAGYNFVGGGWPVDQSPADRGMTLEAGFKGARDSQNADVIQLWIGDQAAGVEAYSGLFLLNATLGNSPLRYWTDLTDLSIPNKDGFKMFQRDRSAFIFSQDGLEDWCLEVPWKD